MTGVEPIDSVELFRSARHEDLRLRVARFKDTGKVTVALTAVVAHGEGGTTEEVVAVFVDPEMEEGLELM